MEPAIPRQSLGDILARRTMPSRSAVRCVRAALRTTRACLALRSRNRVLIDQALAGVAHFPRPVCEVRHVSTLTGIVEAGLALAIVPQLTLPRSPGNVVCVRLEAPSIMRTIGMIWRTGRSMSPAAAAFVALLGEASRAKAGPSRGGEPRAVRPQLAM